MFMYIVNSADDIYMRRGMDTHGTRTLYQPVNEISTTKHFKNFLQNFSIKIDFTSNVMHDLWEFLNFSHRLLNLHVVKSFEKHSDLPIDEKL